MAENVLAYRYTAKITYSDKDGTQNIDSTFIRYFMIENQYTDKTIPVIYLSIALLPKFYTRIISNEKIGKIYLELNCFNALSDMYINKASIKEEFTYLVSGSNPSYTTPLDEGSQTPDDNYKTITLALISTKLMNAIRAEKDKKDGILVSGVFGKIDTDTIIGKVVDGFEKYNLNTIIKSPVHNNQFNELVIPPMNNRKQILNFIFDKAPFYDTGFIFFVDFNNAYLIDQSASGCIVNDDDYPQVIFEINNIVAMKSMQEGMTIVNGAYHININPTHVSINPNKTQEKVANNLVTIDENGILDVKELNVNNSEDSDPKYTFKRGGNAQLYKNILESNTVEVVITKDSLDTSIFTPNKKYSIVNYETLQEYNGDYALVQKRDIIRNNNGILRGATEFLLRKIGNIGDIGKTDTESKNLYTTGKETRYVRTKIPASGNRSNSNITSAPKRTKVSASGIKTGADYEKQVLELSEADWAARTFARPNGSEISNNCAGATKFIVSKDGQTLTKTIHSKD